jgi:asparagine synthase (glutamine-hydrolysing)
VCGIAGHVAVDPGWVDAETVRRMCDALRHRGPDSDGFLVREQAVIGARRLAIIDVRAGDQPLYNEDGTVGVVLNGEIYNFQELRERLRERGHRFATGSDAEVIAHLYEDLGPGLVRELRGMFAFALWDEPRRRLVLARDRVGKKPLLYWRSGDGLAFASELAPLLEDERIPRRADPAAIDAYLALLYVPHPLCAIEGVKKLPPASTLVWEHGAVTVDRYWELDFTPKQPGTPEEVTERVREHLREAVRLRLISERPLGAFLSGGIDSAAVVAAMAELSSGPVKTFSIGFESDRFNELPYARTVADRFGTEHIEHVVRPDAVSILPKLITHYGDPFGDQSAIPSFYVAQAARREVVVALNGDGGDETFAGYNRYLANVAGGRLGVIPGPVRRGIAAFARAMPEAKAMDSVGGRARRLALALPLSAAERYARQITYLHAPLRYALYEPDFHAQLNGYRPERFLVDAWSGAHATSPLDRVLAVDVETTLPGDLLVKIDIATMANSLEARSPFLDHVFMEMAAHLPVSAKVRGTTKKVALKAMLRGTLPDSLLDRPKMGFSVPMAEWLRGPLRPLATEVLLDPRTAERGCFRRPVVKRLLHEHVESGIDRSYQLWLLLVLELWHRRFIDREPEAALL